MVCVCRMTPVGGRYSVEVVEVASHRAMTDETGSSGWLVPGSKFTLSSYLDEPQTSDVNKQSRHWRLLPPPRDP